MFSDYGFSKGKTAPKGIHPDKLRKNHKGRVNLEQRNPHPSKEMQEHSAEWAMLAEAYTDFFELLRVAVRLILSISSLL